MSHCYVCGAPVPCDYDKFSLGGWWLVGAAIVCIAVGFAIGQVTKF